MSRDEFIDDTRAPAGAAADAEWAALETDALARLASGALVLAGCGDDERDQALRSLYPRYAARVPVAQRRLTFATIRDQARSGGLRPSVLAHFLVGDTDARIVADAAFEIASLGIALARCEARGADAVLVLAVTGRLANAGAALGGLLALANPGVNRKLRAMRGALERPEAGGVLEQMTRCPRDPVHRATVEFWLEWMEELALALPRSRAALERTAEGLGRLREALTGRVVFGGHRSLLTASLGAAHDAGCAVPLEAFAAAIAPRLQALVAAAPDSPAVHSAALAWAAPH
ncbi:MAG: hypothetical protein N2544_00315 [Burkholderiales bacterium]|nr:hypothetical protein [Burkholderiales bacterium]